ncbi:hypothetical protein BDN70DRAFT_370938 [Pholiota conissans]|uniref:Uncharacterized protein n=1 Tax=Pholiota conissans TaxID=109636 RepID=A0A9P5ZGM4_9AGAR|nr:hypothetical protein BDN70DRAFT_370938 [Pholiota conissans]
MDHPNSHGGPLPTSEQAADLEDPPRHIDSHRICHDTPPSRPTSRLAFNRPPLSTCPPDAPADSEAIQWSRSLFQNVGIAELRLSAIKQHSSTKMDSAVAAASPPPDNDHPKDPNCSNEEDAGQTGSAEAPGKQAPPPAVPRKSPSVSRLCFPFVTTRKKAPPIPPPTRHKYSCFPSLMSPVPAGRPFPRHPRHSYREHGYSRTALQHVKWFWSMREDTWEGSETRSLHAKTYEGIIQDDTPISRPQGSETASLPARTPAISPQQPSSSMSVYPRRGDISALRDPYCAHIDRCFAGLPVWTINKTLWMYDVHMVTGLRKRQDISDDNDDDSDNDLETSLSTNFSDDSDATLVESESEADTPSTPLYNMPKALILDAKISEKMEEHQAGKVAPPLVALSANPSPHKRSNSSPVPPKASWSRPVNKKRTRLAETTKPLWPTNWYRRWELLVDLSRRDIHHHHRGSPKDIGLVSLSKTSGQYLVAKHHPPDQHSDPTWDARFEIAEN